MGRRDTGTNCASIMVFVVDRGCGEVTSAEDSN